MRSLFLSLAFLAAVGLAALTPGEASAFGRPWVYYNGYSSGYYAPTYSYYGAYPYYTTSSYGGYTPHVSSYYAPSYSAYPAGTSYYEPSLNDYTPIYSGPRYFQGYAPNRLWIYP